MKPTFCGVLVADGEHILLGPASRSPRWDMPKGITEPGEDFCAVAIRELREETGLVFSPEALVDLGLHAYLPVKDSALFAWCPAALHDPAVRACRSHGVPARR